MATSTLGDLHQDIIQTHILPRLDGPSLSATASSSSHLRPLCSDHKLWADISISSWPSITHPRVHETIATFPEGHRSFFQDSFPSLFTYPPSFILNSEQKDRPLPSELISLIDIRYKGTIIYSKTHFTDTKTDRHFLSSPFQIVLMNKSTTHVPQKFDELELFDDEETTLSLLKESVTLNWIIINPTQKRAGNLSVIKPVSVRTGWSPNEFVLKYINVLPGCNPNEMVIFRIQLVLLITEMEGDAILQVKEVSLKVQELVSRNCLNGKDFMVITERAILEENNVRRTVIDDERRIMSYMQVKRGKKDMVKKEEKTKFVTKIRYADGILLLMFCYYMYRLYLLMHY